MIRLEVPYGDGLAALLGRTGEARHVFLLESGLRAGGLGRYSVFGCDPSGVLEAKGAAGKWIGPQGETTFCGDGWAELARRHRARARPRVDDPFPFWSGAVGYCSYESGLAWERVPVSANDDLGVPDLWFGFYDGVWIADETERRLWVVADPEDPAKAKPLADLMVARLAEWRRQPVPTFSFAEGPVPASNFTAQGHAQAVDRIRAYIASGDVYQVNLAQRFSAPLPPGGGLAVYRRLRERSASPYAAYLDFGYGEVVGCSPERFLRVCGDEVSTRPIKGTRPRGATPEADAGLRAELVASEKDRAELLMIVDLERNDLGRVCLPGSVTVRDLYQLETHPTVFHLVAEVAGRLTPGRDVFDVLRAAFPGGSITGAPKVRAMQVIHELEPHRRDVYTGAVGYLGFRGTAELNIAIRTVQCVGGRAYFHAGSGVVWDSSAGEEYAETLAKARALTWAVSGVELKEVVP